MTKVDIVSGFLGAGKTTLIKKLLKEAYAGQKVVLIENEFGEIGIDGGFLQETGIEIKEMVSGCICCSLSGDFRVALKQVIEQYAPDRIIIEPTGVSALSAVIKAVMESSDDIEVCGLTIVVDVHKCKRYMKNFGEFYNDQVEKSHAIMLSRVKSASAEEIEDVVELLKAKNPDAIIVTADWDELDGKEILELTEGKDLITEELRKMLHEQGEECDDPNCSCHEHEHHHEHHEHGHCCHGEHEHHHEHHEHGHCCHGEHEHEHHEHGHCCHGEHEHEHHEHGHCSCGEHEHHHEHGHCCHGEHEHHHEHHHEHGEHCCCGEHEHEHHEHHHSHEADEVFASWGEKTAKRFTEDGMKQILATLDSGECGMVLRAKGIVESTDGSWLHFDFTPGEIDIRRGAAAPTGMLCVIGASINKEKLSKLFGVC